MIILLLRFMHLSSLIYLLVEKMKKGAAKSSAKSSAKVAKVMGEYKRGQLHSGSAKGPVVTNPKQAKAIAMSEAKRAKKK